MKSYEVRNLLSEAGNLKKIYVYDSENILIEITQDNFLVDGDVIIIGTKEQLKHYPELDGELILDDLK